MNFRLTLLKSIVRKLLEHNMYNPTSKTLIRRCDQAGIIPCSKIIRWSKFVYDKGHTIPFVAIYSFELEFVLLAVKGKKGKHCPSKF